MKKMWTLTGITAFWLTYPLLFVYLRLNARTRVIIEQGGKVLIVKPWLGTGAWELPGGGLHISEEARAGAARESFEETGVQLDKKSLNSLGMSKGKGLLPFVVHCFFVKLTKKPPVKKQFIEIIDIKWVNKNDLHSYPLGALSKICLDLWKNPKE